MDLSGDMNDIATGLKGYDTDDTLWDTFTIKVSEQVDVMEIWDGWLERMGVVS
jgi:hypothetical protein